jgi:protein-tyrosine phosphatase
MIDFHSHVLYGIDDGARDYSETEKLLLEAKEVGFNKIISTSHYALDCYETPEYKRKEMINELNEECRFPEIILGSEIFLTYNILDLLREYKASTINGTNYVLFELPLKSRFMNLKDLINKLKDNNYRIILAHPERYSIIQKDFNYLYELQEMGVLFQSNYGSILGIYGGSAKRIVKKMLKNDLVSFLGTDVHRAESIYPKLPKAISKILKYVSDETFEDISNNNAEKILNGENI